MQMSWWKPQYSLRLVTLVGPPSFLWVMWCTSQPAAGVSQPPGHAQCPSRRMTARRMCAGMVSEWPMSSGRLGVLNGGCRRPVRSAAAMPFSPSRWRVVVCAVAAVADRGEGDDLVDDGHAARDDLLSG
jgi:hypothetical protein